MTSEPGPSMAVIAAWVTPPHRQIVELHHLVYRLAEGSRNAEAIGQLAAVDWVTGCRELAPVTARDEPLSRDAVRAEAWVAACVAAEAPVPPESDWYWFDDVYPLPALTDDPEFCYGVWRTLAWIVGVRNDLPTERPERHAAQPDPDQLTTAEQWLAVQSAAEARRRHHAREDARAYWEHVRNHLRGKRGPRR
jgi:hypothetical protein